MKTPVDRTPKPCLHPRADHQHGTRACYVHDKCRCYPCGAANNNYASDHHRQAAYGRTSLVDATPARTHLQALMAAGMGWRTIAAAADVSGSTVNNLLYGKRRENGTHRPPSQRIRRDVESQLLAVRLVHADKALVPSIGSVRRIRALIAAGWTQHSLAARLGITPANFTYLPAGTRTHVIAATARAISQLYNDLDRPPEATAQQRASAARSRKYAAARGWAPPLAWDDEHLDDPAATEPTASAA